MCATRRSYRDEEDGVLVPLEAEAEVAARAEADAAWRAKHGDSDGGAAAATIAAMEVEGEEEEFYVGGDDALGALEGHVGDEDEEEEDVHVHVPSQDDIKALLLERRKQLLMAQYASTEMQEDEQNTRDLTHA
jgi:pre-mRNA-splicing factor ISY1